MDRTDATMIENEAQLEARLSEPYPEVEQDLAATEGDLLVLGVGGKMGPSLARMARRALDAAGARDRQVIGVARFSDPALRPRLEADGIETIAADLLAPGALEALPDAPNVIYMAARKFGSTGSEWLTWALNGYLPGRVAERFTRSRTVVFSSGNVYPLWPIARGAPTEEEPVCPVGEYAQSVLARERMFEHFSRLNDTPCVILRLNYAVETRYGVLVDLAHKVLKGEPVDVTMGAVNVIWQGDANAVALRALRHCATPPALFNLTGPETVSVRWLAGRLAELMEVEPPPFTGEEAPTALLSNAGRCHRTFGYPRVALGQVLEWVAHWVRFGGAELGKPTKFQVRDGRF